MSEYVSSDCIAAFATVLDMHSDYAFHVFVLL